MHQASQDLAKRYTKKKRTAYQMRTREDEGEEDG
jgi:hypothetical protein